MSPIAGVAVDDIARLGAATLHEAGGHIGAIPAAIRAMTPQVSFAGPAVTVLGPPGDNLLLHRSIYECKPGDVLVAGVSGAFEWGYWGEVLSCAAHERGLAGVVIDGCVRDVVRLADIGLPVFGRGSAIRATAMLAGGDGVINQELAIGEVIVQPGDWLVGDADGVVAIPAHLLAWTVEEAQRRAEKEAAIIAELRKGKRTLELLGLT
jgi:4-hydroxy-4-methyl-2-oxoglutarate aldolase